MHLVTLLTLTGSFRIEITSITSNRPSNNVRTIFVSVFSLSLCLNPTLSLSHTLFLHYSPSPSLSFSLSLSPILSLHLSTSFSLSLRLVFWLCWKWLFEAVLNVQSGIKHVKDKKLFTSTKKTLKHLFKRYYYCCTWKTKTCSNRYGTSSLHNGRKTYFWKNAFCLNTNSNTQAC